VTLVKVFQFQILCKDTPIDGIYFFSLGKVKAKWHELHLIIEEIVAWIQGATAD
jgi:hypothetical protein